MVGDGADPALGGAPVGKHGDVGSAEEALDLRVADVVREDVHAVFPGKGVDDALVLVEGAVGLSGDDQLVVVGQGAEGLQQDVQPLVFPDKAEEQKCLFGRIHAQRGGGLFPRHPFSEVGVQRMGQEDVGCVRAQGQQVFLHAVRHADEAGATVQEILGERFVKPVRLVGDDIVQRHHALAAAVTCDITQRRSEPAHPVLHDQKVRFPLADGAGGLDPGEGIDGVQDGLGLYRQGFVLRGDVLRLAGEEKVRVLAGEGEGLHNMTFSQPNQHTGVELGNAAPQGVETGQ